MEIKCQMLTSDLWDVYDPRDLMSLVEAVKIAEEEGVTSISVSEHIVVGKGTDSGEAKFNSRDFDRAGNQTPDIPWPSSPSMLSAFATATSSIEIIAQAVLPVLRHPLLVANDLATIDLLSKGRLRVAPSVGWHKEEYDALGIAFNKRGKMMDEILEIWKLVWSQSPASYKGEFYEFEDVWLEPKPWTPGGPPIFIPGDRLHKAALRRLVKYGSGLVLMSPLSPDDMALIQKSFEEHGRDVNELEVSGLIPPTFETPDGPADLDKALEAIAPQVELGYNRFMFKPSQFMHSKEDLREVCSKIVGFLKQFDS